MSDSHARRRRLTTALAIGSVGALVATGCFRPRPRPPVTTTAPVTTAAPGTTATTMPGHGHDGDDDHGGPVTTTPPMDHGHGGPNTTIDTGGMHHIPDRLNHPPTAEQKVAAQKLIDDTKAAAIRNGWNDVNKAKADGFKSIGDEMSGVAHYANSVNHHDGKNLDPDHVEVLVYTTNPATRQVTRLQTFMYVLEPGIGMDGVPDIAGTLTVWHAHSNLCYSKKNPGTLAGIAVNGVCQPKNDDAVLVPSEPMLHVWVVDNPCGPFAGVDPGNRTGSCDHEM
jgi:hypothetical protein